MRVKPLLPSLKRAHAAAVSAKPTPERNHRVSPVAYAGERGRARASAVHAQSQAKPRVPVPMPLLSPRSPAGCSAVPVQMRAARLQSRAAAASRCARAMRSRHDATCTNATTTRKVPI